MLRSICFTTLLLLSQLCFSEQNVLAATGWTEIDPTTTTLAVSVDIGPGYYYNPTDLHVSLGQRIKWMFESVTCVSSIQVRYSSSGAWQTVFTGSGAGSYIFTHPWTTTGQFYIGIRYYECGVSNPSPEHAFTAYVVPAAQRAFVDAAGNTMTLWEGGNSTLDKPLLLVEGFDPTNENYPEKYYYLGAKLFNEARARSQDMVVFNFAQGGIDLAVNAQHVTDGIIYIKYI